MLRDFISNVLQPRLDKGITSKKEKKAFFAFELTGFCFVMSSPFMFVKRRVENRARLLVIILSPPSCCEGDGGGS